MRRILASILVAAAACGAASSTNGDAPAAGVDGQRSDAVGSGPADVVDAVACDQVHTRTAVAADGSKTVSDTKFSLIGGLDPAGEVLLEQCDYVFYSGSGTTEVYLPVEGACPTGYTCTSSGAPLPSPTHICNWSHYGTFFDDKLYVTCGGETRSYNSAGTLTSTSGSRFGAIRIHH